MYDSDECIRRYNELEHGKARIEGIYDAIKQADENNDVPFQLYFRLRLCYESDFYWDKLDMFVIFPQVLALIDKYPDAPCTKYYSGEKMLPHVMWDYKWLLMDCTDFYQIPMEDCLKFYEDFKRRSIECGYSLRSYYRSMFYFYENIDKEKAEAAFYAFEKEPRDENSECKACERNTQIRFYLNNGDFDRAEELAKDIESFNLRCGGNNDRYWAWGNMKLIYLQYYINNGNLEKAMECCRILERRKDLCNNLEVWDDLICCYAYADLGKALRYYKQCWKKFQDNRNPRAIFRESRKMSIFFKRLSEGRKKATVKLNLDSSFPLYREDGEYRIDELQDYYYRRAYDVAVKLDERNGCGYYVEMLGKEPGFT